MIKLSFSAPKYKSYNFNRIITCTYDCKVVDTDSNTIFHSFSIYGKATCADCDEANWSTGAALAESNAKYNAYRKARKLMFPSTEELDKDVKEFCRLCNKLSFYEQIKYLEKNEDEHIKFLISEQVQ